MAKRVITPTVLYIPKKFYYFILISKTKNKKEYWRRFVIIYPVPYVYLLNKKIFT
jgi:hypothetical protein